MQTAPIHSSVPNFAALLGEASSMGGVTAGQGTAQLPTFEVPAAADPSKLIALLVPDPTRTLYDHGGIGTTPEAGQLFESGQANFSNPRWLELVEDAAARNGGFGTNDEGFLAWGQHGFFRFKNETIPPELSAEYARISLNTGLQIEKLKITNEYNAKDVESKREFVADFNGALNAFLVDPSKGFKVSAGREVYAVTGNDVGGFQFFRYKKPSGFQRAFGKVAKWLSPVLNVAGWVFPVIKPIATAVSWGIDAANKWMTADYVKDVKREIKSA